MADVRKVSFVLSVPTVSGSEFFYYTVNIRGIFII